MKWDYKLNTICLFAALGMGAPICSNAEETTSPSIVSQIKAEASEVSASIIPKITQYAKAFGKAAVCNPEMARKNHDEMVPAINLIHLKTRQLAQITAKAFAKKTVSENMEAQANEIESLKKNGLSIANKEILRRGILASIFGIKKLLPLLQRCEADVLNFPEEILSNLKELDVRLDALNGQLSSPNWAVPAVIDESIEKSVKNNMIQLSINALELQKANVTLHKKVVDYLTEHNQQSLEDLNQELEELKNDMEN